MMIDRSVDRLRSIREKAYAIHKKHMDLTRKKSLPMKADIESTFQPLIKEIKLCLHTFNEGYQEWVTIIDDMESESAKEAETLRKDLSMLEDECNIIADLEYDLEEIQAYMEANFGKLVVKGETPLDKMVAYMEQGMPLSKGGETFGGETTEGVVAEKFVCKETEVDQLKLQGEFQVKSSLSIISQEMKPRKRKKVNPPHTKATFALVERKVCKKAAMPPSIKIVSNHVPSNPAEFQRQQKFDRPPSSYSQQQKKEAVVSKMLDVPPGFEEQQQKCYLAVPPGFETCVAPFSTTSTKAFNQNVLRVSSEKLEKSKKLQRKNFVQQCQKLKPCVSREVLEGRIDKFATSLCGRERLAAQDDDKLMHSSWGSCEYELHKLTSASFFNLQMAKQQLSWKDKPPESIWEIQC